MLGFGLDELGRGWTGAFLRKRGLVQGIFKYYMCGGI